jgi:nitroimidazol reductase NimA-like FMN-containing flavoprotein (pyridoxamine 5'-phosphate oxidase superfamily)
VGFRKMEDDETAEFLAQPLVAVIAVDEPGWSPHVTPVWFHHLRGENRFRVMTAAGTKKARLHREGSGQLSLCVQAIEGTTAKYVNVQGEARLDPLTAELLQTIAEKYLPPEHREAYIANPPEDSMFEITPRRIVTGVID